MEAPWQPKSSIQMRPLRALTTRRSQVCGRLVPTCFGTGKCIVVLLFTACITARPTASDVLSADRGAVVNWSGLTTSSGDVILYRVLYKPVASLLKSCAIKETEEVEVATPPGLSSVTLRELRPYTLYRVAVVAIGAGRVPLLKAVVAIGARRVPLLNTTFQTKAAAPDGPPRDLRHSTSAAFLEVLTWSEVACDLANGEIRSYYLKLHSGDPWEMETHEHNATSTVHTFVNLAPFTRYAAKVFAQNDAGRSPYFASVNFTTAPFPPPQPTDLLASHLTQDSVRVSWNAPYPPHGVLDNYRLLFWSGNDKSKATEITIVHEECRRRRRFVARHCYTVKGLEPRSVYRFSVRAANKGTSYSPYSAELVTKTKDSGPPRDLHITERTENSLRILWYAADGRNEESRTYTVNSSLIHTFNQTLAEISPPQSSVLNCSKDRELHLSDLHPGSTYLVCVQENTAVGSGEAVCANFSTRPSIPVIKRAPGVDAVDGNTVTLSLTPVDFHNGPLTAYYLLVVKKVHEVVAPIRLVNFSSAEDLHLGYYVGASFTTEEVGDGIRFVVGAGDTVGGFANPPLEAGAPYSFGWAAETNFSGETLYGYRLTAPIIVGRSVLTSDPRISEPISGLGNTYWPFIAGSLLCLTAMALATTGILCCCRKRRSSHRWPPDIAAVVLEERVAEEPKFVEKSTIDRKTQRAEMNEYISTDSKSAAPAAGGSPPSRPSNPVPIKRFQEYVTRALVEGTLELEYTTLRNGRLHPTAVAEKPDNMPRNCDGNILPYDHSRVVLTSDHDIVDYINASYIPGFRNPRRYIAAQSPSLTTTSAFWQMVWQENILKVVALSEPKEEAVYWPESQGKYGSITVTLKKTELTADFAVRELEVSVGLITRSVTQFHYTAWPYGKMPLCTDSLESFIAAVRAYQPGDTHPVMVHSRFGVGRTGTFILIDSAISQSEAEGEVDCLRQLHSMRHSRMNMVETQEQYIAAHKVLVNMACSKSRKLTIEEFLKLYQNLKATHPATGKSPMCKEFEELSRMRPHPDASEYKGARDERNAGKNRSQKILAADSKRPLLNVTMDHSKTDYINAVYVDGFRKPNAFLVTQMPLNETMDDFWEMVASSGSITVVTLGPLLDQTTPMFWPDLNSTSKHGKITVEHRESTGFPGLVVRSFNICQGKNPSRMLKQFHCPTWRRLERVAGSHDIVLDMLRRVDTWQMLAEGAPVIVQCLDGCQDCGLYCVLSSVCEQLKLEHEVDVFRCVQRVRASRPEFIVSVDQYAFCYEVTHRFIDSFGSYSNFTG